MQNVKWQAVIPAIIVALALGFYLLNSSGATNEKSPQFRPISSEVTPSVKPEKVVDNDNLVQFDPSVMPTKMGEKVVELFPDQAADAIHWVKQKNGWEAQFENDGQEMEVEFDESGNWLETELESVSKTMIPQHIMKAVQQRFPACQFKEFEIEYTAEGTFYEIEIIDGGQEREVYYNAKGEKKSNLNED
jgi:uncharacterized membrane protein YkoI